MIEQLLARVTASFIITVTKFYARTYRELWTNFEDIVLN